MSFQLTLEEVNQVFDTLRQSYRIYAPKRLKNAGRYCNTDLIRYQEIRSMEEIEWEQRSDYSPKEVFYPINQTLFHFTEHYFLESQADEKDLLIFTASSGWIRYFWKTGRSRIPIINECGTRCISS